MLKEIADLEECSHVDNAEVAHAAVSGKFVFVLEESDDSPSSARPKPPK